MELRARKLSKSANKLVFKTLFAITLRVTAPSVALATSSKTATVTLNRLAATIATAAPKLAPFHPRVSSQEPALELPY